MYDRMLYLTNETPIYPDAFDSNKNKGFTYGFDAKVS